MTPGAATFEFRQFRDATTGGTVTRLTPTGVNCRRNYFYQKAFTRDGRTLLFAGEGAGTVNFWLLDLESGKARQVSWGPGVHVQGAYLSADDRSLFFHRGRSRHVRIDLKTLEETVVYQVPPGWVSHGTWTPNSEGTRVIGLLMRSEDRVARGTGWDHFSQQFEAKPLQRLVEIDLVTGRDRVIHEERRYLGHPTFRPFDDNLVAFCHEGPHDLVDSRIWFVRRDGTNLRPAKDHAPGESVMHEFWVPNGSRMLYVSYFKGENDRSVWAVDPQTLTNERLMTIPPCAHLMSNHEGTLLVGDGAGQLGDVADKAGYRFEPDPFLHLIDLNTRTHRRLCGHFSSWKVYDGDTQAAHPHPSFTPQGDRVLFASDFEGDLALYLADLP